MANGDKAAAKGWTVFPATQPHNLGYDDINYVADLVAQEVDDRTAAITAARARTPKINISATPMTAGTATVGDLRFYWS